MRVSRRKLAGRYKNHAMYFKFVDPEDRETEHYEVYEDVLDHIRAVGLSG
jgi:hypothetical protein